MRTARLIIGRNGDKYHLPPLSNLQSLKEILGRKNRKNIAKKAWKTRKARQSAKKQGEQRI